MNISETCITVRHIHDPNKDLELAVQLGITANDTERETTTVYSQMNIKGLRLLAKFLNEHADMAEYLKSQRETKAPPDTFIFP